MTAQNNHTQYSRYLQSISFKARLYRRYFYFPKLNNKLKNPILEVGCGIGGFLSLNKSAIGVDINSELVDICKQNNLKAQVMEIDKLPFDSNKFNSVLFDNVLEHIENPEKILKEINRVLKLNGILAISVPGERGFQHDPDHKLFYDFELLNETLKKSDFVLVDHFYTPFKSEYLNKKMRQYCLHGIFKKK